MSPKYSTGKSEVVPSQAAGVRIGESMQTKPRESRKSRMDRITSARSRRSATCFRDLSHRWRFRIRKPISGTTSWIWMG